jgi:hypothetical protein
MNYLGEIWNDLSWELLGYYIQLNQPNLSLMLLSALALILVWDAFNEVQFAQRLGAVIKKELAKFF